jgi:hypothetical protein
MAPVTDEGVRVVQPRPGIHLQLDPSPGDRLGLVDEVAGQPDAERLRLGDDVVLGGEGVDGVLLGVGRQARAVVAGEVHRLLAAGQRHADVVVDQLMGVAVAEDPHHPVLRLAVLVVAEHDCHASAPPG